VHYNDIVADSTAAVFDINFPCMKAQNRRVVVRSLHSYRPNMRYVDLSQTSSQRDFADEVLFHCHIRQEPAKQCMREQ